MYLADTLALLCILFSHDSRSTTLMNFEPTINIWKEYHATDLGDATFKP